MQGEAGKKKAIWLWLLPLLWAASIFATSSSVVTIPQLSAFVSKVSGGTISIEGFTTFWLAIWWFVVKGWHAAEFAILTIVLLRFLSKRPALAVGLAALGALLDEMHQVFVPGRGGRLSDVAIDCLGILAVVTIRRWKSTPPTVGKISPRLAKTFFIALWVLCLYLLSMFPFGTMKWDGHRFTTGQQFAP